MRAATAAEIGLLAILGLMMAGTAYPRTSVCFSPHGACDSIVVQLFDGTKEQADVAIYSLTNDKIRDAIVRAKQRGVRVRVIADPVQAAVKGSDVQYLKIAGIPVKIGKEKGGIFHHKFGIFDGKILCTGSFNWTDNAVAANNENLVVTDEAVQDYRLEFERLWKIIK